MWLDRLTNQNVACYAPFDMSSGGSKASNHALEEARQGRAEGRGEAALGNTAKSVDRYQVEKRRKETRKQRFALTSTAGQLLPKERVRLCKWAVVSKSAGVDINLTTYEGGATVAHFGGLQTCGSVWHCPICGKRISETRRGELNDLLSWARERGLRPVMLTLTARHSLRDDLGELLAAMKKAKQRLRQRKEWRRIKGRIVGTVTATEVTYGVNGWHVHFHEIILIEPTLEEMVEAASIRAVLARLPKGEAKNDAFDAEAVRIEAEAMAVLDGLAKVWRACLTGVGLSGGRAAWHVQGAASAGRYVAKWGAGEEMTLSSMKAGKGKGRSPLQLLSDAHDGDEEAGRLWQIYGLTFKGARQLVWSPGLKALAGIGEVSDEDAVRDEMQDDAEDAGPLLNIEHDEWVGAPGRLGARHRRGRILDAVEAGGAAAARRVIEDGEEDEAPVELVEVEPVGGRPWKPRPGGLAATLLAAVRPPLRQGP